MTSSSGTGPEAAAIRLHSLGDVVLCQPAAAFLASRGPVAMVTSPQLLPVVERFGGGVRPAAPETSGWRALRSVLPRPAGEIYDFQGSLTTLLATFPSRRTVFRTDRTLRRLALAGRAAMPLRWREFASLAGGCPGPPRLQRRSDPPAAARVGLVCGGRWPMKSIPVQVLAELARLFSDLDGMGSVLIGGPADACAVGSVAASAVRGVAGSYAGERGVAGLLDALEGLALLVSPDSGPAHAAAALGVPVLVVFTSTSPALGFWEEGTGWGPAAACSPCHRHGGLACRRGGEACRRSILPAEVREAAVRLLERR